METVKEWRYWTELRQLLISKVKPICILGTGQTITNLKPYQFSDYSIWALNHAIQYPKKVCVAGCADAPMLPDIELHRYSFDAIFTRHINFDEVNEKRPEWMPKTYFAEYAGDVATHGKVLPVTYPIIHSGCSIDTCMYMLGVFGFTKVYMAGIDGSPFKHDMFRDTESYKLAVQHNVDYKAHNERGFYWAKKFNIQVIKL